MSIASFADANLLMIQRYPVLRAALREDMKPRLDAIITSTIPPEVVSLYFELVYANRDDVADEDKLAAADVGSFAWTHGFWGLGVDDRGRLMEMVLRGTDLPDGAVPPATLSQFAPPIPLGSYPGPISAPVVLPADAPPPQPAGAL